jgi:hypothetical protein
MERGQTNMKNSLVIWMCDALEAWLKPADALRERGEAGGGGDVHNRRLSRETCPVL